DGWHSRHRPPALDATRFGGAQIGAADDDGLVRVSYSHAPQAGEHGEGRMLPELPWRPTEDFVCEMQAYDAVGFAVLELQAAHENGSRRDLALVLGKDGRRSRIVYL